MKLTKKLLAMALAGVMLLTILTGCSGGKTGDRLVEEYIATYYHDLNAYKDKPITNDVPEIKTVAEKFDPSLLDSTGIGFDGNIIYSDSVPDSLLQLKSALAKYSSCNSVQREHNKKLNNGLPILHKVPPKRDYGRYFCIMAEKGGTSHGGLTEKLSPFFHAKKQEVNAYGR